MNESDFDPFAQFSQTTGGKKIKLGETDVGPTTIRPPVAPQNNHADRPVDRIVVGVGVVGLGLISQRLVPVTNNVLFGLIGMLLCTVGLAICVKAKRRHAALSLFGLVPIFGPLFPLATILLENLPARFRALRILGNVVALVLVLGIPSAIAQSYWSKYVMHSRQSEAKIYLNAIYVAQKIFYKEHKRYGTFDEIGFGFAPSHSNRYTYRIDNSGKPGTAFPAKDGTFTPENTVVHAGISPDGQHFTATATGNIDDDPTLDQWHLNDIKEILWKADVTDTIDEVARYPQ